MVIGNTRVVQLNRLNTCWNPTRANSHVQNGILHFTMCLVLVVYTFMHMRYDALSMTRCIYWCAILGLCDGWCQSFEVMWNTVTFPPPPVFYGHCVGPMLWPWLPFNYYFDTEHAVSAEVRVHCCSYTFLIYFWTPNGNGTASVTSFHDWNIQSM